MDFDLPVVVRSAPLGSVLEGMEAAHAAFTGLGRDAVGATVWVSTVRGYVAGLALSGLVAEQMAFGSVEGVPVGVHYAEKPKGLAPLHMVEFSKIRDELHYEAVARLQDTLATRGDGPEFTDLFGLLLEHREWQFWNHAAARCNAHGFSTYLTRGGLAVFERSLSVPPVAPRAGWQGVNTNILVQPDRLQLILDSLDAAHDRLAVLAGQGVEVPALPKIALGAALGEALRDALNDQVFFPALVGMKQGTALDTAPEGVRPVYTVPFNGVQWDMPEAPLYKLAAALGPHEKAPSFDDLEPLLYADDAGLVWRHVARRCRDYGFAVLNTDAGLSIYARGTVAQSPAPLTVTRPVAAPAPALTP